MISRRGFLSTLAALPLVKHLPIPAPARAVGAAGLLTPSVFLIENVALADYKARFDVIDTLRVDISEPLPGWNEWPEAEA